MEKLFKFVGILLVGMAIGACITANTKVDITPLKMVIKKTIEKVKNFDIVTPKKTETTKKLSHSELLEKIRNEVGDDAVELWMRMEFDTEYLNMPDEPGNKFERVHDIVTDNLKTSDTDSEDFLEFRRFVYGKGYVNKDGYWFLKDEKSSSVEPALTTPQQPKLPKNDFTNTKFSDDFVAMYRLDKECIKTYADKTFDIKWCRYLRQMANLMQQKEKGYNTEETVQRIDTLLRDLIDYQKFLSPDCLINVTKKFEHLEYDMERIRRL
jgi:hypothetical protein